MLTQALSFPEFREWMAHGGDSSNYRFMHFFLQAEATNWKAVSILTLLDGELELGVSGPAN